MNATPLDAARCIPILASLNIRETAEFYTDLLGFSPTYYVDDQYLIVRRDEMEIHFWYTNDRSLSENSSCYVRGGQVIELYEDFTKRGVPRLSEFLVRPWDMKEFHILDPHGNLLRFGCAPQEAGSETD